VAHRAERDDGVIAVAAAYLFGPSFRRGLFGARYRHRPNGWEGERGIDGRVPADVGAAGKPGVHVAFVLDGADRRRSQDLARPKA